MKRGKKKAKGEGARQGEPMTLLKIKKRKGVALVK